MMNTIAILGSGFGLYGYLPSMTIGCGQKVVLPERYRKRFNERAELQICSQHVRWVRDEMTALQAASGAVIAVCPTEQCRWLDICIETPQLQFLFLEKPLAPCPDAAYAIHDRLKQSGKVVRIAYLFRYLEWAKRLVELVQQYPCENVKIRWDFLAHHFRSNSPTWKREPELGGGPVRFYGIHLIALLAELGYENVSSLTEGYRWQGVFTGDNLPRCDVDVDTASDATEFSVTARTSVVEFDLCCQESPFDVCARNIDKSHVIGALDARVDLLSTHCQSAWNDPRPIFDFYKRTIDLWNKSEISELACSSPIAA